jgi:HlyD family secretion protein
MAITPGRILSLVAVIGVAALVYWSLIPNPVPVETAVVRSGAFVATVDEDGKTRIRERFVVAAPLSGRLMRLQLKPGDTVKVDQAIATILPSPAPFLDPRSREEAQQRLGAAEATLARSQAMIERARAQAAQSKSDLERTRTLKEGGSATIQALERAETAMNIAERDLRAAEFLHHAAEHEVNQAKALLAHYHDSNGGRPPEHWSITAPVAGVVLNVVQESETIVQAGTPILGIGDPRDLEVVVDVLSTDAVEIRPGAPVMIEHWGGPGSLAGRVRRVEPAAFTKVSTLGVEEQRVNVLIDIVSPESDRVGLGDAYQVDTRITVFSRDNTIIVPAGALFRQGNSWSVYVAENGRARRREVDIIRRSGALAAAAKGLETGERVLVYPSDRIRDGIKIDAR